LKFSFASGHHRFLVVNHFNCVLSANHDSQHLPDGTHVSCLMGGTIAILQPPTLPLSHAPGTYVQVQLRNTEKGIRKGKRKEEKNKITKKNNAETNTDIQRCCNVQFLHRPTTVSEGISFWAYLANGSITAKSRSALRIRSSLQNTTSQAHGS
jgi:hypothetical protein